MNEQLYPYQDPFVVLAANGKFNITEGTPEVSEMLKNCLDSYNEFKEDIYQWHDKDTNSAIINIAEMNGNDLYIQELYKTYLEYHVKIYTGKYDDDD
ncbi:hypothetical protein [Chroococcus sp. FPU101]|uniref:hypothetical protein n=1 Tax=Chroococcus sp. FPU101 TaxID=1974212 RepID=UPI001A8F8D0C|nr:hypothetical protein [Chroococcus sp. FPU101]